MNMQKYVIFVLSEKIMKNVLFRGDSAIITDHPGPLCDPIQKKE